ncbi:MAG TPA: penicillin acylase family protein [Alphaproteobacteria bacterium]|nr:penicillin acylase family protein [Alphaproteobacteria bacterium]
MPIRIKRILKYAAGVMAAAAVLTAGYGAWLFVRSMPDYEGHVAMAGLSAPVEVFRDKHGVPEIFAANLDDAARALGYIHASERLFQMEIQRRAGQGRLSEILGPSMLGVDTFTRTMGFYRLAEGAYDALSPEAQKLLTAYAAGVNDWLATHKNRLPPQFVLLGFKPEAWKPADSLVWAKLMAFQLSNNEKLEVLRARLARTLSPAEMNVLFPMTSGKNTPVTLVPQAIKTGAILPADPITEAENMLEALTGLGHGASNEWVIAGSRTTTGKPILANDPHLGLEAPILWYLARIKVPGLDLKGATVPGLPVVLLGQNGHIAWGLTTTGSDVEDLFRETVDAKNPGDYLTPKGPKPFDTRTEVIRVKGAPDVTLNVRTTRHGPVLSDIDPELAALAGKGKVMALAFTALLPGDRTPEALFRIDRATDWPEFLDALKLFRAPPQNFVYADRAGHIGFIAAGWVPIRKEGNGLVPVAGASGAYDWTGMVPFKGAPQLYDPAAGFIFNTNNDVAPPSYPYFLGVDWEEPYRARRLREFLGSPVLQSLESSAAMQADHVSLAARDLLPYLLRIKPIDADDAAALKLLKNWHGLMDKDLPQPLIFTAWLLQMHRLLLADKTGDSLTALGPFDASAITRIMAGDPGWCAAASRLKNQAASPCEELAARALHRALQDLRARYGAAMDLWQWGEAQVTRMDNAFYKHIPGLAGIADLRIPSSGSFYTLDRGGSSVIDPKHPFARTHGGGFRGIYDLADPAKSRFMIATGESGHIFSRHYADLLKPWNAVKSFTLAGSAAQLKAAGLPEMVFEAGK